MMMREVLFGGFPISTVQIVMRSGHEDEVAFNVPTVCVPHPALQDADLGMTTFNVRCQRNLWAATTTHLTHPVETLKAGDEP